MTKIYDLIAEVFVGAVFLLDDIIETGRRRKAWLRRSV